MDFDKLSFQRVFSKSMYKSLKLPLGEMTFFKDFVNDKRGDLYPVINKDDACLEQIISNRYYIQDGCVERMFNRFFPFATYQVAFSELKGKCGFVFHLGNTKAELLRDNNVLSFFDGTTTETVELKEHFRCSDMVISCRPKAFDVYFINNDMPTYCHTFFSDSFADSNEKAKFDKGYVSLKIVGSAVINAVSAYIDCGISQADIRAVCYENGDPIFENGKIFFTATIRMQEGAFQGIFSLIPSTSSIELTGTLFFDCGDGFWRNYLASSLLYNRLTKEWYIWTSSFEHKHILCYAKFSGEPRFGVNVIDVTMMEQTDTQDITAFSGFRGDEDPDFYYNEQENAWYMAICRISPVTKSYVYMFFKSSDPFRNYKYIGQGYDGAETGGSFVNINGEAVFICGNDFKKRSNYRIYTKNGMYEAKFDFDDGGFRGWGTVIPVSLGSRKRYFWLTFDRHNGSEYNWSYGNFYCFELNI